MQVINRSEIQKRRQALDFELLKINVQLPLFDLRKIVEEAIIQFQPIVKDGYSTYRGIGLQFANPSNPIFDCVEQTSYEDANGSKTIYRRVADRDFITKNEVAKKLDLVFDTFAGIEMYRGRILIAKPGHRHAKHSDGKSGCRIHIPIVTNPLCQMHYQEQSYHMQADGSAYICNTELQHSFENAGETERIHIVFVI